MANPPDLPAALAAQARYTARLLRSDRVIGTAVGLTANGRAAVLVFTRDAGFTGLPTSLDGVPVSVLVTGEVRPNPATPATPAASTTIKARNAFPRPVPIGVSTGNEGGCSSGTIGARVKRGATVFALSNNHIYALENSAPLGSRVLQPGRYDLNCSSGSDAVIGTLSRFVPVVFSLTADNVVDAAIAGTSTGSLDRSTPADGYGTPGSTPTSAILNQAVQKYGRTTGLTSGTVVGVNATLKITYDRGTARFVRQILIRGRGQFSRAGDSGSLIVTDDHRKQPVGLLFAGSSSGYTFANPIGAVVQALNVKIDGT